MRGEREGGSSSSRNPRCSRPGPSSIACPRIRTILLACLAKIELGELMKDGHGIVEKNRNQTLSLLYRLYRSNRREFHIPARLKKPSRSRDASVTHSATPTTNLVGKERRPRQGGIQFRAITEFALVTVIASPQAALLYLQLTPTTHAAAAHIPAS